MIHTRATQIIFIALTGWMGLAGSVGAQQSDGPQTMAPPAVAPTPKPAPKTGPGETIIVPAGTRVAVILENGISTGNARAGDSVYFRTSFPITQNNHVIIPVGSYLRGELTETKRPGRLKGRGEFRMRLNTLILPNGYTVDLTAVPRSADSGGKETTDSEGKITGPGGKGKDVGTVASTTVTGAGIGAIAQGARGAGIGAGAGAVIGLAAVLLTRGPDAQLPRGSALDIVLERQIELDSDKVQYSHVNGMIPRTPVRPDR
ncbi:MAG: hypothetical protein PVS2B2_11940 [Candidatus Acidiferrum sp.]